MGERDATPNYARTRAGKSQGDQPYPRKSQIPVKIQS
jgi:hypothetical protein